MNDAVAGAMPKPGGSAKLVTILGAISGTTALVFVAIVFLRPVAPSAGQASDLPPTFLTLPDFTLMERSGKSVSRADLLGSVWVAGFIFTRCHETCPMVTGVMARLRSELPSNVRMVTITVDPRYDRPAVLRDYAAAVKADPERWWFLTGDLAAVNNLLTKGFLSPAVENPPGHDQEGELYTHTTRLAVVDKKGNVLGFFDSRDPAAVDQLARKVKSLLKESP